MTKHLKSSVSENGTYGPQATGLRFSEKNPSFKHLYAKKKLVFPVLNTGIYFSENFFHKSNFKQLSDS